MIEKKTIQYEVDGIIFEAFYAYEPDNAPKAAVMIGHDWSGRNEFVEEKAEQLAALGYLGFALDVYGKGSAPQTKEEKSKLMSPLVAEREVLQQRLKAAYEVVKSLPQVDTANISAIGYCFGGLCVLDLARMGLDLKSVVGFHAALHAPSNIPSPNIKAKILVLHGFADPTVPPEQMMAFTSEMVNANADWELNIYGKAMHAFCNPAANDQESGLLYHPHYAKKAWHTMVEFLQETT